MLLRRAVWAVVLGAGLVLVQSCATPGPAVEAPRVTLRNVRVTNIDLSGQSFLLDFDVTNPNGFPLPVRSVAYGVELDGYRFAAGRTDGGFTVPAGGDQVFAISVDVNLLRVAPQLMFIVREGVHRDIPYILDGEVEIAAPLARAVQFRTSGVIRITEPAL